MASLLIKSEDFENQVIKLRLGVTRLGRSPKNDFQIEHKTISAGHCELTLANEGLVVRDLGSTNGTFVNDEPVEEAKLQAGQTLRVGDIEMLVESTDVVVAIPKFEVIRPAPPVVLTD